MTTGAGPGVRAISARRPSEWLGRNAAIFPKQKLR